jgi:hypothetical protein
MSKAPPCRTRLAMFARYGSGSSPRFWKHREGDQRELVQRRAVVLFRRAQNGEMHQVDRRIGLQQAAPGALPLVRLARYQQHAQPVAHAIDLDHRSVVQLRHLAGQRAGGHFDHRGAGAGDRHFDALFGADGHALDTERLAVAADGQRRGTCPPGGSQIVDRNAQGDGLADDAIARCLDHPQAAVGLLALGGQQQVQRRAAGCGLRHVVQLAVGDRDRPREPGPRDIRQRPVDLREQRSSRVARLRHRDRSQFQVRQARGLRLDRLPSSVGEFCPVADLHGCRLVDDQQADIAQRLARLLHQPWAAQPQ